MSRVTKNKLNVFSYVGPCVRVRVRACVRACLCACVRVCVCVFNMSSLVMLIWILGLRLKVIKRAKIRNRFNQVPQLTQDTNGKVTNSQLDITNESQEVSPFPAVDHKATINRRAQKHNKHATELTWLIHKRSRIRDRACDPWISRRVV